MNNQQSLADFTQSSINLFLIIFLSVGVVLAGLISAFYHLQTETHLDQLKTHESLAIANEKQIIDYVFNDIIADLDIIAQQPSLHAFLATGQKQYLDELGQVYLIFSKARKLYDQVRFLGADGMEMVRVDFNRGKPAIVPAGNLQNKQKRYYFADSFALGRDGIFVSPMDLNIEHGQVETPLKPMIRFGKAVFDEQGKKRGVVLLNYLGSHLLRRLEQTGQAIQGQPLLLNQDGYWLLGPQPDDAWGFMLEERKHKTLPKQFPLAAPGIMGQDSGQIISQNGMFSFTSIHPLKSDYCSSSGSAKADKQSDKKLSGDQYIWKLVSYVSHEYLSSHSNALLLNLSLLGGGLFLLTAMASWLIASSITRKRLHRAQLFNMAHFDTLTGLPNRTLYFDRLHQAYESSKRHGRSFAILYIDLDDFKKVNDTMGHSAGDMLLKIVSQRMLDTVRKTDTVGRMGGDEFMIILTDIQQPDDALAVAQKLLTSLTQPVPLGKESATVGACIGIAIYPHDSEDKDTLIRLADEVMYLCKAAGKNKYKTVADLEDKTNTAHPPSDG